jgi:hypothetical protein
MLHSPIKLLACICVYIFDAISNCLFFLCRLEINHMTELQKCAFILELGLVTVPDKRIWEHEVVVVRRIINLGTGNL